MKNLEFSLLADHPACSKQVAAWYFDEWAYRNPANKLETVEKNVAAMTSRLGPPLIKLAFRQGRLVGAAELKLHEMDSYPEFEHWMGGVYVVPEERGKGIGSLLVEDIIAEAQKANVEKLYLQTKYLNGGLYAKHGFQSIERADSKGDQVMVMCKTLK